MLYDIYNALAVHKRQDQSQENYLSKLEISVRENLTFWGASNCSPLKSTYYSWRGSNLGSQFSPWAIQQPVPPALWVQRPLLAFIDTGLMYGPIQQHKDT